MHTNIYSLLQSFGGLGYSIKKKFFFFTYWVAIGLHNYWNLLKILHMRMYRQLFLHTAATYVKLLAQLGDPLIIG